MTSHFEVKPLGHYLITGGLGGLGLKLAQFLTIHGAATIHLVSRRKPNEEIEHYLAMLKKKGVKIETHSIDISEWHDIQNLIATITQKQPLTAIFHLAGVLDDAAFMEQDRARIDAVARPKAVGARFLHEATQKAQTPLIFFSSIASLLGSTGQLNYAIANSYLDSLTQYRKQQGLTTITIQWGPWAEVGMAVHAESQLLKRGIIPLPIERGFSLLEQVFEEHRTFVAIADIRWQKMSEQLGTSAAWLSELTSEAIKPVGELIQQLKDIAPKLRNSFLKKYISDLLKQVLGMAPYEVINDERGFFELGIDSLMAVDLRMKLQVALGSNTPISTAELFNYPDTSQLARFIGELIGIEGLEHKKKKSTIKRAQDAQQPIAVVGMGCRYPGGANSPKRYWQLLTEGFDGICEVPDGPMG